MKLTHNPVYANLFPRFIAVTIDSQLGSLIGLYSLTILTQVNTVNRLLPTALSLLAYAWLPLTLMYPLFLIVCLTLSGYTPGQLGCDWRS